MNLSVRERIEQAIRAGEGLDPAALSWKIFEALGEPGEPVRLFLWYLDGRPAAEITLPTCEKRADAYMILPAAGGRIVAFRPDPRNADRYVQIPD